jgi:hypothetical protein
LFFKERFAPEFLLSITGAIAALVHFLYAQHNHNTERFIGLFRDFTARYDRLNNRLNAMILRDGVTLLSGEDKLLLYDYFNLCAEEYLYFKSGYIDIEVWQAWLRGMGYFASNSEIRRLWQGELDSDSYYGFSLALIDEVCKSSKDVAERKSMRVSQ